MVGEKYIQGRKRWTPVLSGGERVRAQQIATEIANRLQRSTSMDSAFLVAARQIKSAYRSRPIPDWLAPGAIGFGAASGHISLCPLFAAMYRLDGSQMWRRAIEYCMVRADTDISTPPFGLPRAGLFGGGLAGYLAVATYLAHHDLHAGPTREARDMILQSLSSYPQRSRGLPWSYYDTISGLSGTLVYFLDQSTANSTGASHCIAELTRLAREKQARTPQGWAVAEDFAASDYHSGQAPRLVVLTGLAHGVAGPLSALSQALPGSNVIPTLEPLSDLADWLVSVGTTTSRPSPAWPFSVDVESGTQIGAPTFGWCSGSSGVAVSLWQAGRVLGRGDLVAFAEQIILDLPPRIAPLAQVPTNICHGLAGAGVIAARMAVDSPRAAEVAGVAHWFFSRLMETFDPSTPLGYPSYVGDNQIDDPGFLTGAAGVALALLLASTPVHTWWMTLLMMSGDG